MSAVGPSPHRAGFWFLIGVESAARTLSPLPLSVPTRWWVSEQSRVRITGRVDTTPSGSAAFVTERRRAPTSARAGTSASRPLPWDSIGMSMAFTSVSVANRRRASIVGKLCALESLPSPRATTIHPVSAASCPGENPRRMPQWKRTDLTAIGRADKPPSSRLPRSLRLRCELQAPPGPRRPPGRCHSPSLASTREMCEHPPRL